MQLEMMGSDALIEAPQKVRLRLPAEDLGAKNLGDWQGQQLARQLMCARHSQSAKN
jgi:hypothetical protein